jgi:hypothetical protein
MSVPSGVRLSPPGKVSYKNCVKIFRSLRWLNVAEYDVISIMKTEETAQPQIERELQFDAHEFDGLREDLAAAAEGWLKKAEQFVRDNPWVCIAAAAGIGCALAYALRQSGRSEDDDAERKSSDDAVAEAADECRCA